MLTRIFPVVLLFFLLSCAGSRKNGANKPEDVSKDEKPIEFVFPAYKGDGNKPKIAIMDFSNDTPFESAVIGTGLANSMVTALVKSKHFRVIERSMIDKIISEQALSMAGVVDASAASEIGKLLGVDFMIIGSLSEFGVKSSRTAVGYGKDIDASIGVNEGMARVVLDVRVIDPNTGEILNSENGIGTQESSNIGLAYKEISLLTGTTGFDQTLIGKASRKAIYDIVYKFVTNGIN